jgi:hypothetical protein
MATTELTPQQRSDRCIDHEPESLEVAELIKHYDFFGVWEFGGDGDNGEELLYYLDVYFSRKRSDDE